ncbi:glutamate-5-semialdehyde dehydrogenase [Hydrogenibacillus schlegelii]|nr:glutamate-5-semialdehyde dehydrogenase [Hydrogenibacillus schlegelii]
MSTSMSSPDPAIAARKAEVEALLRAARAAAGAVGRAETETKNAVLRTMGEVLWREREAILAANAEDVREAAGRGTPRARLDRLTLTEGRLRSMIEGLEAVAALPDPVGRVAAAWTRPNGLRIEKVHVPFGVIAIIYEARPNVTVDAAALALKAGSAVVLRGSRDALRTNSALVAALQAALEARGFPPSAVTLIKRPEREVVDDLITARGLIDLVIPRGGAGLIRRVVDGARVPVIETGIGNNHLYVDRAADVAMAVRLAVDAKVDRPSVCNAIETLLVHREIAEAFLPEAGRALSGLGVELRACPRALEIFAAHGIPARPATDEDYAEEFLDLILAVRVVDDLDEALQHIARYGTNHSEAIVTDDPEAARRFLTEVDAAAVYHNASTRFTDGGEFGFGAEMGISTQKLHARGPVGLPELTTVRYRIVGHGQIRGPERVGGGERLPV